MTLAHPSMRAFAWRPALAAAALAVAAIWLGLIVATPNLVWYDSLQQPGFAPPDWVFAPAWAAVCLWMGCLFWRVARLGARADGRRAAIAAFVALLIFQTAWFYAFFAAHDPGLGFIDVVAEAAALIAAVVWFGRIDGYAGLGFAPVALWTGYVAALDFMIWLLN